MTVLVDASPLIHLARLGLLQLLRELFTDIRVTREVREEVLGAGERLGVAAIQAATFIVWHEEPMTENEVQSLRDAFSIGAGEAATFASRLPS